MPRPFFSNRNLLFIIKREDLFKKNKYFLRQFCVRE